MADTGMSTGAKVAVALTVVALLGGVVFLATRSEAHGDPTFGLESKIERLHELGYKTKIRVIRGVRVFRATLPRRIKLTRSHPFRALQAPINQASRLLAEHGI